MQIKTIAYHTIIFLLVLLWVYTALSKITIAKQFAEQLNNQVFSAAMADLLFWLLPTIELTTAVLLIFNRTSFWGLSLSFLLMLVFTLYVGLIWFGYFNRIPCSCGGVLTQMGWKAHFWFNLVFLTLSAIGMRLSINLKTNQP